MSFSRCRFLGRRFLGRRFLDTLKNTRLLATAAAPQLTDHVMKT